MQQHFFILANPFVSLALVLFCANAFAAEEAGWTRLFNGKNLEGWVVKCRPEDKDKAGYWKVVDGKVRCFRTRLEIMTGRLVERRKPACVEAIDGAASRNYATITQAVIIANNRVRPMRWA